MKSAQIGPCLPFTACGNFRELGGIRTEDGRHVRRGVFYRGPALLSITSEADRALFKSLGIRTILDFRAKSVRERLPDPVFEGVQTIGICASVTPRTGGETNYDVADMAAGGMPAVRHVLETVAATYRTMPFENPAYREFFRQILAGNTPILFHCTSGKDRTGVAAMLLLKALGVGREAIMADYLRTNDHPVNARFVLPNYEEAMASPHAKEIRGAVENVFRENLETSFREIETCYPDWDSYFETEYGLTRQALAELRERYLE